MNFKGGQPLRNVLHTAVASLPAGWFPRYHKAAPGAPADDVLLALLQDLCRLPEPVVLNLDTYEDASADACRWVEGQLLSQAGGSDRLRVVVAGQRVPAPEGTPWEEEAVTRELPPIDDLDDWCDYARRVHIVSAGHVDEISTLVKATRGSARMMGAMLSNLYPRGVPNGT